MIRQAAWLGALALVLLTAGLAGCGSTCVAKGDRVEVTVASTASLNDSGQGAQHVRFQVWAVKDAQLFAKMAAERPDELANAQNADRFPQLGKAIDSGEWIKPASSRSGTVEVTDDAQFTHVGIIALYTTGARTALIPLSCQSSDPGYGVKKPVHSVRFSMDEKGVGPAR
jgi:predicted component of type VI protein secretion system